MGAPIIGKHYFLSLGAHSNLAKTCGDAGSESDLSNVSGISSASAKTYITEESSLVLERSEKVGEDTVTRYDLRLF